MEHDRALRRISLDLRQRLYRRWVNGRRRENWLRAAEYPQKVSGDIVDLSFCERPTLFLAPCWHHAAGHALSDHGTHRKIRFNPREVLQVGAHSPARIRTMTHSAVFLVKLGPSFCVAVTLRPGNADGSEQDQD
jgi:hypothetical protein